MAPKLDCSSGKCVMLDESTDTYRCECNKGYTGPHCETELEPCGDHFCYNDGSCNPLLNRCECPAGWAGEFCQNQVTCRDRPCRNGGVCSPSPFGVRFFFKFFHILFLRLLQDVVRTKISKTFLLTCFPHFHKLWIFHLMLDFKFKLRKYFKLSHEDMI